jgi:hypothetical protein
MEAATFTFSSLVHSGPGRFLDRVLDRKDAFVGQGYQVANPSGQEVLNLLPGHRDDVHLRLVLSDR